MNSELNVLHPVPLLFLTEEDSKPFGLVIFGDILLSNLLDSPILEVFFLVVALIGLIFLADKGRIFF